MQNSTAADDRPGLRDPHPNGKPTIFGVQALRFIAAAMVVVTHALNREIVVYRPPPMPRQGWMESGVDIFFVISGFIMVYILKPDSRPLAFWLQRFTRIAPLYWVATIIAFFGGLVLPEWFLGHYDFGFAVQSLLFMPLAKDAGTHPLISPGWTLIYEFAFYTLLSLCLAVRRPPFATAAVAIILVTSAGPLLRDTVPWLGWYSDQALMVEFLFGMAAAVLVREHAFRPWQGLVVAAAGLVLISFLWDSKLDWPRGIKIGLPAFLTVMGFLISEPIWQRYNPMQQFARLGDASYSIYIVHFFFISAIATLFQKSQWTRDTFGPYGFTALMVVVGLGSGVLAHLYIEKPLLRIVRGWLPRRQPRTGLAAAKV